MRFINSEGNPILNKQSFSVLPSSNPLVDPHSTFKNVCVCVCVCVVKVVGSQKSQLRLSD